MRRLPHLMLWQREILGNFAEAYNWLLSTTYVPEAVI